MDGTQTLAPDAWTLSLQNAKTSGGWMEARGPLVSMLLPNRALGNTTNDQPIHVVHEIQMSLFIFFFSFSLFFFSKPVLQN